MSRLKLAAWMVHFYTALGGFVGVLALFVVVAGQIRLAFLMLILTMLIDATDGILARRLRVGEVLPGFSGAEMDNVIDVLTFVWVPVFIIGMQGLLPHWLWLAVPVFAALYAYGQVEMKTEDAFFLGFPSYWSTVALYLYWLRPEPGIAVLLVVIPGILTFIPTRYLYPSKNPILWRLTWALAGLWFLLVIYLLFQETPDLKLIWLSLFFPIYYLCASFIIDWRLRRGQLRVT
ncbi:MAG: CDP-alcohol phosphatidyltransferase family protein [Anaerolineaceae bacterium]|nr:CDP-alcohol phosphatidyltransferase family protein [Anaerolineaceae bacterium]